MKKNTINKLKSYFKSKYQKSKVWLGWRNYNKHNFKGRQSYVTHILLGFLISVVIFSILYSNRVRLNEMILWIVKIGSVLLLVSLYFSIKYGFAVLNEIYNFFKRERNWVRYLIIIVLLFLLWHSYTNRETILNPVFEIHENTDYSYFFPLDLDMSKVSDSTKRFFEPIKDTVNPPERDMDAIESKILGLVNEERARNGARALSSRDNLNNFARAWSDKMIAEGFFEHSSLNVPFASSAGENIGETPIHYNVVGCGSTYSNNAIAECFVTGWVGSPGHHENMIDKGFSLTGIGVACDFSMCRATQVFTG